MKPVGFDNTMLSLLLNPNGGIPVKFRSHLTNLIQKSNGRVQATYGASKPQNARPKKPDPPDDLPQIGRFKAVANECGCDDDETTFRAKQSQIAWHKAALAANEPMKNQNR